jgi:hypothetical protein
MPVVLIPDEVGIPVTCDPTVAKLLAVKGFSFKVVGDKFEAPL